ncbi:hypothetical protein V494_04920 [Pseudogymnoascus sp. VKM F-4513 (FW-928)]|nr:hypothetical protein V494_04920 [Pseudogymnoascus sp. VKM F-4513 (FW-928)]
MSSVKKYLRKKLLGKKLSPLESKSPTLTKYDLLPFLPPKRPSILTPSPSRDDLASPGVNYGLFQKLPYEIRRQILIEAFGERTLHVDLSHNHPLVRKSKLQTAKHCDLGSNLVRDTELPMDWQWFGCVCHRPAEWPDGSTARHSLQIDPEWGFERAMSRPGEDNCLIGGDNHLTECGPVAGEDQPSTCFIGVMGWLLTCRQAYADGIDVLFTTNIFHITGHELIRHLPRMLLPQRLRGVRSLEMLWLSRFWQPNEPNFMFPLHDLWADPTTTDSELHALCQMVLESFPNVHQLSISLECIISPPEELGEPIPIVERVVLGPIEDMLRVLGTGREYKVYIQMVVWDGLLGRHMDLYGPELRVEKNGIMEGRFWKVLDPDNELGYWICSGKFYDSLTSVKRAPF